MDVSSFYFFTSKKDERNCAYKSLLFPETYGCVMIMPESFSRGE